ncbi:hypothetical protein AYJ57_22330 (plasmid) [Salipiger sp. CCB-MM3]|uniref:hypothetical protein n=1 Tax=Salipiger sp. CCB-MM3 TaxID=1792508 RepID=UPI00080AA95F|nr:hypothetical protein [Salipiger sp. CCB-MM3]ANT63218.1 hypothetical protein AYJ57_22330 [Salipiger sp. CCB-MM3]
MVDSLPLALAATGAPVGAALFGGNILAPRGEMTGTGSYAEAVSQLGVTGLRYPGGSLTEYYFDLADPDATLASHAMTGAETTFIPLSEFMGYAAQTGHAVTIVLPTRDQLSDVRDETGNRLPDIDEEVLRDFVHDLASGGYGAAEIAALEIGNEYWGSGEMTAVEYGRLATDMAEIIADELALVAEVQGIDTSGIRVLAQMGQNYGFSNLSESYEGWDAEEVIADLTALYPNAGLSEANIRGSGEVNWSEVTNALVQMGFETEAERDALDGIVTHVYARGTEASRSYALETIQNTWLEHAGFEHLEIHVTEWNFKSTQGLDRASDYGLFQAQEMLQIVEEFILAGVDQAHVWPLIQNTANALSTGFTFEAATVPGEMFAMMASALPGKTLLDFVAGDDDTDAEAGAVTVHAFAGSGEMVLYLMSQSDAASVSDLDLSGLVSGFGAMEITVLGVAEGEAVGDTGSVPDVQSLNAEEVYADGVLEVDLDPREIMQVVIRDLQPSEAFAPVLAEIDGSAAEEIEAAVSLDMLLPETLVEEDAPEPEEEEGDAGGWGSFGMMLALLPLAGLLGF